MKKEYHIYINGEKIEVSEQVYKVYWQEKEHEKYLRQVDEENHLLFFSSIDKDGHLIGNIVDDNAYLEKIVETQLLSEIVRKSVSMLSADERDIIESIYFNNEPLRLLAERKGITHSALIKKRNKILTKLRRIIEKNY